MEQKLSVCLMNDSFPPVIDGVANAVVNYATVIEKECGSAVVVTPRYPDADDSAFPFPVLRYPSLDTTRLAGYRAGAPFSPETAEALKKRKIDLIHTHCPMASTILARLLRDPLDAPVVFTYHTKFDIDIGKAVRGKLVQEAAIRLLVQNISACDETWVVSRGAGENLRSLGYEGDYTVMPNGVEFPRGRVSDAAVAAATGKYHLPENVPIFLFVGRMMWYKGLKITVDALRALRDRGQDFFMVMVGDGTDRAAVEKYVAEQGLEDRFLFTGSIRDRDTIRAWYCRCDLFLFPSTFDTNGLVVREAAACALPSVLVRGSCAAEDAVDGETGFFIEENAESMAQLLLPLCRAPQKMAAVGQNAMEKLYLSWEDAVKNAYAHYGAVVERHRAGGYHRPHPAADELFRAGGELMEGLARFRGMQTELHENATESLARLRELSQKATDLPRRRGK